jgi:hypothetical protein
MIIDRSYAMPSTDQMTLHTAVKENNIDMVLQILNNGADINTTDTKSNDKKVPLHVAIEHGNLGLITALLERGADVNIPENYGVTSLMMALQKRLHGVVETLLQTGALLRDSIRQQLVFALSTQVWEIEALWDVSRFVRSELPGRRVVEELRKVVTLTGSVKNSQMMSCEDYVAQTWHASGLDILDTLIEALRTGHAVLNIDDRSVTLQSDPQDCMRIIITGASESQIIDIMEQIAWLGCVFTCKQTESGHGPFLATANYWLSSTSPTLQLSVQNYSLEGYLDEPCWTNLLRKATLAVGFPVRKRPEGLGLEIPFPLLLRFADISVSMDYDGGTLLVGESTILFPSRQLEDGIQWHIADAKSGQEAFHVIAQSSEWVRTNNIGQLAQQRAYLGYRHALVLLGTRELIKSQRPIIELSCRLPETRSQIEMVREGTMGAGISVRGIFSVTIGGKWVVPARLNVSLEDDRDVEDRLMNACQRPILVYDRVKDGGWLVPELSLVVHMALTYLNRPEVRRRCFRRVQEALPYIAATADGGEAAYNVIKTHWKTELYRKIEDGQMKTFGMVIRDFMKDLQKLRTAENIRRVSKGVSLNSSSDRSLRGWDFSELVLKEENMYQKEMKWKDGGPMWAMLGDSKDMLVILGSCLGELICPDLERISVTSGWESIPKGAGLLTATNSCVLQLAQKEVLLTVSQMTPEQPSEKLFWYRPTIHPDCNCHNFCLSIHEITQKGIKTCTETRAPRRLQDNGATVFGCASPYHKSLKKRPAP